MLTQKMQVTLDRFNIITKLGSGSSCEVMMAIDTKTGQEVAIKILNENVNQMAINVAEAEINSLCKLKNHSNIIGLREFGTGKYKHTGEKTIVDYIVFDIAKGG